MSESVGAGCGDVWGFQSGSGSGIVQDFSSAIESVDEIQGNRTATEDVEGAHRYVRYFAVETSNGNVDSRTVRRAPGIPVLGDTYCLTSPGGAEVEDRFSKVVEVHASQPDPDNPLVWHVSVHYDREGSPVARPKTARWSTSLFERPIYRELDDDDEINKDGILVANTADDPFPGAAIDENRLTYHRSYWSAVWIETELLKFKDSINKSQVTIGDFDFPPKTLKIRSLQGERELFAGQWYWLVQFEIEYRKETWALQYLNLGFRAYYPRTGGGVDKREIMDSNGRPLTEPKLLDAVGAELGDGEEPIVLEFDGYPELEWGDLDLDHTEDWTDPEDAPPGTFPG